MQSAGGRRRGAKGEDGFTILEIVVAVGVIFVAMVAMAHAATIALIDVGYARQRQSATGLANKVVEQVRALPASTVRLGLSAIDLASTSDPNVSTTTVGGVTRYVYDGEEILTHTPADTTPRPPLIPHRTQTTVGPTTYWVAAYTTLMPDGSTVRVTADVSWTDTAMRRGAAGRVQVQSLFSPGVGCGTSLDENPYGAPCAASFNAEAAVDEPTITVKDNITGTVVASLTLPRSSSTLDIGQVSVAHSTATTSGAAVTGWPDAGGDMADAMSSSDPDVGTDAYVSDTVFALVASPSGSTVIVTTSAGDSGTAIATRQARGASGEPCLGPDGFDQTDHLPCGSASSRQMSIATVDLLLPDGATLVPLVTVGPAPAETVTTVDRTVDPSSTSCGLEGCVAVETNRSLGLFRAGGGPSQWLAEVHDLVADVAAGAGEGAGPPYASMTGEVRHPAGAIDLATLGVTLEPFFPTLGPFPAGAYSVMMEGSFTARGASHDDPAAGEPGCTGPCRRTQASATADSPLNGSFRVLVQDSGLATVADLTVEIELGRTLALATYEQAPGAL